MEFVVPMVGPVVQRALGPICRQCGYMIFHKSNLDNLRDQRDKLDERIRTVQQSIEVAERNLEVIKPDVEEWMKSAEKCSEDAKCILDQYDNEASKWCLKWCPNIKSRYSLSREATKKAKEVAEIRNEGNFNTVSNPAPQPPIESTISTEGLKGFESRGRLVNKIMNVLNDENENMIGICGMGGVGKTTMAKEIIRRVKQEKLFGHVVMATISKPPDMREIQGEIADCLGIKLNAESTSGRAWELFGKMEQARRIFVVLDDIWEVFELGDIGIPFGQERTGCKILLTSRSKEVVEGMGAKKIFVPQVLTGKEAWSLFKEKAGIPHDEIEVPPNLLSKQKKVAKECGGLPLAIVCVAAALKGKGEYSWDYALLQLQHSIVDVAKKVHMSLEFSYNELAREEVQRCFLLCSMYPEDFYIPVEDLVRYGFAMNFFKAAKKVDDARVATISIIDTLKECYLLMDSGREGHVKMHDVIRDVAISIASKEEHPFMKRCDEALGDQLNEDKHKSYPIISVECSSRHMLPSNLELPELSLFRLVGSRGLFEMLKIPDSFYQGMQNLKVIDLCNIIIDSFPALLGCLSGLHTLSLNSCEVHGDMSIIGKMKSLEILSFRHSDMEELPIEMGQLTQLKLLDLGYSTIERIPQGFLSSLSNLVELYVGEVKGALLEHTTELSSLSNLVALDISLDCNELWPMNWTLENMKNFDIQIGLPNFYRFRRERYMFPNTLDVKGIDVPNIMQSGLRMPLKVSKQLCLTSIRGLNNDFGEENYEYLIQLELENCENIEYLINATRRNPERAFPVLKLLHLSKLQNFKQIYQDQSQKDSSAKVKVALTNIEILDLSFMDNLTEIWPEAFHVPLKLRKLRIGMCPLLNSVLLPSNWMQCDLEEIYVQDCQSIEVLFDLQEFGHLYYVEALPVLKELKILRLHKLVHVWKINTTSLISFQGFQNLRSIKLEGCNNLRSLFPTYVAKLLQNLEELKMEACGAMENIVGDGLEIHDHDGEGTSSGVLCLFPRLKVLSLISLPKLRSLCPQRFTFFGTCLEEFTARFYPNTVQYYCDNANEVEIVPSATNIHLLDRERGLEQIYVEDCQSVEFVFDLQIFGHPYSIVARPMLYELKICHLPKLIHVWKIYTISPVSFQGLQNLQSIEIKGCDNLRNLFPTYIAKLLQKLVYLSIKECRAMENIVANESEIHDHDGEGTSFSVHCLFPQLRFLYLMFLPKLRSLCPQGFTFTGTCLEKYTEIYCPNIEQHYCGNAKEVEIVPNSTDIHLLNGKVVWVSDEKILLVHKMDQDTWYKDVEVQTYLDNAEGIIFLHCERLLSVASSNLMGRLHELKGLLVGWCDSMEAIFDFEGLDHEELSVNLPSALHLTFLPKLIHIWKIAPQQNYYYFSRLTKLKVKSCDSLRYIFTVSMAKALVTLSELVIKRCKNVEKIVATCERDRGDQEPVQFFGGDCSVKLKCLPNLICFGPEEDCSQLLVAENLDITVIFCRKYKGPGDIDDI